MTDEKKKQELYYMVDELETIVYNHLSAHERDIDRAMEIISILKGEFE